MGLCRCATVAYAACLRPCRYFTERIACAALESRPERELALNYLDGGYLRLTVHELGTDSQLYTYHLDGGHVMSRLSS